MRLISETAWKKIELWILWKTKQKKNAEIDEKRFLKFNKINTIEKHPTNIKWKTCFFALNNIFSQMCTNLEPVLNDLRIDVYDEDDNL